MTCDTLKVRLTDIDGDKRKQNCRKQQQQCDRPPADEAIFLSDRVYCMTARPGTIKAEIAIPLERPRQQSMMMSSEFLGLRRGLMSLIREESIKAMGGEVTDLALDGLSIDVPGQSLADLV